MSSVSFFSSPLRSINSCQSNTHTFFTPQAKPTWNTSLAQPASLPLRTSHNANVMPLHSADGKPEENFDLQDTENIDQSTTYHPVQARNTCDTLSKTSATDKTPVSFLSSTPSLFSADFKSSFGATQFQFQARARSSSPSVQLQSHTASRRDSRKRLFLDRLRNKRDNDRYERSGDQVLRLDYIRERRAWEADMRNKALGDLEMNGIDTDNDPQMMLEEAELSPTEDKEIEELLSYFESNENKQDQDEEDFSSGEDYDALFMEVLNQEPGYISQCIGVIESNHNQPPLMSADTDMDM